MRKRPREWFYAAIAAILRPFLALFTSRTWRGAENLPTDVGFIAAANHASAYDPMTVAHFLYNNGYYPRILAKSPLFKVPVLGWALRGAKMIPVYRGTAAARESIAAGVAALAAGECVAVFPEGTLTRDPNLWPMVAKTGVARMALTSRAPVIPIGQWGAHRFFPKGARLPRFFPRPRVYVTAGPPVDLSDLYDAHLDAGVLREATDRIMNAITAIVADLRGEEPPAVRFDMRVMGDPHAKLKKRKKSRG